MFPKFFRLALLTANVHKISFGDADLSQKPSLISFIVLIVVLIVVFGTLDEERPSDVRLTVVHQSTVSHPRLSRRTLIAALLIKIACRYAYLVCL